MLLSGGRIRHGGTWLFALCLAGLSFTSVVQAVQPTTYSYDGLGRVRQVTFPDNSSVTYVYDSAGNRVEALRTSSVIHVTTPSVLRTLANNAGYTGTAGAHYTFVVDAGVTLSGTPGGGRGIDTGTWPSDAVLVLIVNGTIYGGGGNGGNGSNSGAGSAGTSGGNAIYCAAPITIVLNSGAVLQAPGGGGGGGGYSSGTGTGTVGGDGGGGGFPNGLGGTGTTGGSGDLHPNGAPGTMSGGGLGGASGPPGGKGGDAGLPGISGSSSTGAGGARGAAGYAIRKNGNAVVVTNNGGTIIGPVA